MEKQTLLTALVGILLVVAVFQAFQLQGLTEKVKASTSGAGLQLASAPLQSVQAASQQASGGETYDQMMARMHPDLVKQQSQTPVPQGLQNLPSQVSGC